MKKIFRFATLLMIGSFVLAACNKPSDDPNKPDDPNNPDPEEQTVSPFKIALDGAFADWDAITEDEAKKSDFADVKKGGSDDPIQVMKITSDADNVYFYMEFKHEYLPNNDLCSEWGNSWDGTPELGYKADDGVNDAFREVIHLFIDPDGNDKTGFLTLAGDVEGEPAIPDLGCEMCSDWFFFYKPSTKKVCMAWNQTNIGPYMTGSVVYDADGKRTDYIVTGQYDYTGTLYQSWPDSGDDAALPLWGWQNDAADGKGDNIAPGKDFWKPAVAEGAIAKLEFAIEKKELVNLKDEDEEFACGIMYTWGGYDQNIGPLRITYSE